MTDFVIIEPDGDLSEGDGFSHGIVGCHGVSDQMLLRTKQGAGPLSTMLRMMCCKWCVVVPELHERNPVAEAILRQFGYPHQLRGPVAVYRVDGYLDPIPLTPQDLKRLQGLAKAARADQRQVVLPLVLDDEEPTS